MTFGYWRWARSNMLTVALLSPLVLASCRVTSHSVVQSQKSQDYQRLEIIYRAHPATGPLFSPKSSGVVQAAAQVSTDAIPYQNMSWSKVELRIECPHPDGRADMAKVTLHFRPVDCGEECERKSWDEKREERAVSRESRRATFRERWFYAPAPAQSNNETVKVLDLPKSELDAILRELNSHGFFAEQETVDSEAHLEVRLNRRWTSRRWGYEPSLDALTTRVYYEGTSRTSFTDKDADHPSRFAWLRPFGRSQ